MSTTTDTLSLTARWALHLAGRGWAVFPLTAGTKRPAWHKAADCARADICTGGHRTWEHLATTDPARIRHLWHLNPHANVGVACGPSNLLVVDCDTVKPAEQPPGPGRDGRVGSGAQVLRGLARRHDAFIAPTYAVRTASGGWHLYYVQPAGAALRNTAGTLGWKLDTRGHGGYVVGPGSVLPNGVYDVAEDRDTVVLPGWLHRALIVRVSPVISAPAHTARVRVTGYVAAALEAETVAIRNAAQGQRNRVLSRASYALGQLIGAGVLDHDTARAELVNAWHTWGTPGSAAKDLGPGGVIETSLTAGKANPRRVTGGQERT